MTDEYDKWQAKQDADEFCRTKARVVKLEAALREIVEIGNMEGIPLPIIIGNMQGEADRVLNCQTMFDGSNP